MIPSSQLAQNIKATVAGKAACDPTSRGMKGCKLTVEGSHFFRFQRWTKDWFDIYFGRSCLPMSDVLPLGNTVQVRKANSFSCSRNEPGFVLENLVKQNNRSFTSPSFTKQHFPPMEKSNSTYSFHHPCSESLAVGYKGRQELPQLL